MLGGEPPRPSSWKRLGEGLSPPAFTRLVIPFSHSPCPGSLGTRDSSPPRNGASRDPGRGRSPQATPSLPSGDARARLTSAHSASPWSNLHPTVLGVSSSCTCCLSNQPPICPPASPCNGLTSPPSPPPPPHPSPTHVCPLATGWGWRQHLRLLWGGHGFSRRDGGLCVLG